MKLINYFVAFVACHLYLNLALEMKTVYFSMFTLTHVKNKKSIYIGGENT